jgi:hypothetical protein
MEPDDLLCSRNARSRTPLVGRAQWKINQPLSPWKQRASVEGASVTSFDGRSGTGTGAIPRERNEQAWREYLDGWWSVDARSEDHPGHS